MYVFYDIYEEDIGCFNYWYVNIYVLENNILHFYSERKFKEKQEAEDYLIYVSKCVKEGVLPYA